MNQKTFAKLYTSIIWTVTLVLVLVGIGQHIGGIFDFGSKKAIENTVAVIKQGDKFEVTYKYPEKYAPKVTISAFDKTLEIKQKQNKMVSNNKSDLYRMEITIPEGTKFISTSMNLDYGRLVVSDLESTNITANCDAGDFEVKDCTASNMDVNVDMGEINIKDSTITTISVNADMGDVNLDVDADTVGAHCDMGNVTIKTAKTGDEVSIKAHCNLGKVTVNGKDW